MIVYFNKKENTSVPCMLVFTELASLGQFSHKVAMTVCVCVCVSVCLSVCLRHQVHFFRPLICPEVTCSVPGLSLVFPPPKITFFGTHQKDKEKWIAGQISLQIKKVFKTVFFLLLLFQHLIKY